MRKKLLFLLRSKLKTYALLLLGWGIVSCIFTFVSNEMIRNRFPWITKILYQEFWKKGEKKTSSQPLADPLPIFQKPIVTEQSIHLEFPAIVEPTREIQLQSKQNGRIAKLYVVEGQTVKKGQILLTLDDDLIRLEGEKLLISAEVAKTNQTIALEKWKQAESQIEVKIREIDKKTELLEVSRTEWEHTKEIRVKKEKLWQEGFLSGLELERWKLDEENKFAQYHNIKRDRANLLSTLHLDDTREEQSFPEKLKHWKERNTVLERTEYELSVTNAKILEKQIEANKQLLSETKLVSPKNGKIFKIHTKEGELTNHLPLVTMIENGELSISFQISENDLKQIKQGKTVEFIPSFSGSEVVFGKIDRIGGYLDSRSHSIGIKANLFQKKSELLTGMFGTAKIATGERKEIILIPKKSMLGDEVNGNYLHVKNGENIEKRFIQSKVYNDSEMEVIAGLKANDLFQINVQ